MTIDKDQRLIETAFPLEQVSLDAVHEKNVRHGHISTLHIWPARRPLAACRAALIATLLPETGSKAERDAAYRRMAGRAIDVVEEDRATGRTRTRRKTEGGILHWKRETGPDLEWFRTEIRKAYGGRAPKVLDPFAGGGAIPLEAMRLGCEVTAVDINPVAWFILKCTLDYPHKLAGQTRPLPDFALKERDFMTKFLKARGITGRALKGELTELGLVDDSEAPEPKLPGSTPLQEADLAWQVRAWGRHVLANAKRRLAMRYPTYAAFAPLKPAGMPFEPQPERLLTPDADGETSVEHLNADFDAAYLKDKQNPRWFATPTVAYLWARTVRCKGCRATIPMLKTRWLARKGAKRVLLTTEPNDERTGVVFGVDSNPRRSKGNPAEQRAHDKRIGAGTMNRSGVQCPLCQVITTMQDLRLDGRAGRLGQVMTAIVVDGPHGKQYRLPTDLELQAAHVEESELESLYAEVPFGLPTEPTPSKESLGMRIPRYGFDTWRTLFTNRQLLALGTFVQEIRHLPETMSGWPEAWREAVVATLTPTISRLADRGSSLATWTNDPEKVRSTFARFALPMVWDFVEACPLADTSGGFVQAVEWTAEVCEHLLSATHDAPAPAVLRRSAGEPQDAADGDDGFDLICTDPPYYDAIPYSDLMDFFHVWLRRALRGLSAELDRHFETPLGPKWNAPANDGELIDDAARFGGDREASKRNYEAGMARAFARFHTTLRDDGRLVIVFANKSPDAWETLVSALIRTGFVVDGSWPIRTEMETRQRSLSSAALASSIWIVCRKRPTAHPGWDRAVLGEMRENITERLREFWDAGIRGPDFVWAATGPALEAFSKYPVVKRADAAGSRMTVSEFLQEVRRFVVDFVVGRVLTRNGNAKATTGLDDVTTYYVLHRHHFQLDDAPIGGCILYAISCNVSDRDLTDRYDLLARSGGTTAGEENGTEEETDGAADAEAGSGKTVRLKPWNRRRGKSLGERTPDGGQPPLIDQTHRLMQLWRAGDQTKVGKYLDKHGLRRHTLFIQLLQGLIELAPAASEERSTLEVLSNYIDPNQEIAPRRQPGLGFDRTA